MPHWAKSCMLSLRLLSSVLYCQTMVARRDRAAFAGAPDLVFFAELACMHNEPQQRVVTDNDCDSATSSTAHTLGLQDSWYKPAPFGYIERHKLKFQLQWYHNIVADVQSNLSYWIGRAMSGSFNERHIHYGKSGVQSINQVNMCIIRRPVQLNLSYWISTERGKLSDTAGAESI
ncbi:hypothetical protein BDZ91DRAFT_762871 [Kalaharituber pfeilii]|nr:hypothetical protein BDZ91DRAFT_762871 [Kalaharituber pfeilii]